MQLRPIFGEYSQLKALLTNYYPNLWAHIKDKPLGKDVRLILNHALNTNVQGKASVSAAAKDWIEAINVNQL